MLPAKRVEDKWMYLNACHYFQQIENENDEYVPYYTSCINSFSALRELLLRTTYDDDIVEYDVVPTRRDGLNDYGYRFSSMRIMIT